MARAEPDPGFTFVDRRGRAEDHTPPHEAPAPRSSPPPPANHHTRVPGDTPRADLASLCVMLYSDALVHLGQAPDPVTGRAQPDLDQARFAIDLLAMIKEKTERNRTPEESTILDEMLTTLRMEFVRASRLG